MGLSCFSPAFLRRAALKRLKMLFGSLVAVRGSAMVFERQRPSDLTGAPILRA
jgi:hypothetical protein